MAVDMLARNILAALNGSGGGSAKTNAIISDTADYNLTAEDLYGLTRIRDYAFYDSQHLTGIEVPSTVTYVGHDAFGQCIKLETADLSEADITSILNNTFQGCSALAEVDLPDDLTSIGNNAFKGCSSLENIDIPSGVNSIGSAAFQNCSSLETIDIPSGITTIQANTFNGCTNINGLTMPGNLSIIGDGAFQNCSSMTLIDIPNTIDSIGANAFNGCTSLGTIVVRANEPPTLGTNALTGVPATTPIYVPDDYVEIYKAASGWSARADYIFPIFDYLYSQLTTSDGMLFVTSTGDYVYVLNAQPEQLLTNNNQRLLDSNNQGLNGMGVNY